MPGPFDVVNPDARIQGVKIRASGFTSSNDPGVKGDESFENHVKAEQGDISKLDI